MKGSVLPSRIQWKLESMNRLVIAGGSGSIGQRLIEHLSSRFEEVVILSRSASISNGKVRNRQWDAKQAGDWIEELESAEVLINLTGKSIQTRFTPSEQKLLRSSRIESTRALGEAIQACNTPPKLWLNASGAAIYPSDPERIFDEECNEIGTGFLASLSKDWEDTFFRHSRADTRMVAMRITPVLDESSGVFPTLSRLARLGLGGVQGRGNQYFSWIHRIDLCRAVEHILSDERIQGPVNMSSPTPVTNKEFMKTMRKQIGIGIGLPAPEFAIRLGSVLTGVDASLILDSSRVFPKKLIDHGFMFNFPELADALPALEIG